MVVVIKYFKSFLVCNLYVSSKMYFCSKQRKYVANIVSRAICIIRLNVDAAILNSMIHILCLSIGCL